MQIDRTTIIPTEDVHDARRQFTSDVCSGEQLTIVVLGDNKVSQNAVECADLRARVVVAGFERRVYWIKNREALANELKTLKAGMADLSKEDLSKVVAFSLSTKVTVEDVVYVTDEITATRMETAFLKAGTA